MIMISNAFIALAFTLINGIVSALPQSGGFSPDVLNAAGSLGSYFGMFSPLIPMGTLASAVGLIFAVEIGIFGWKTIKSIVSHIPAFGGSGH